MTTRHSPKRDAILTTLKDAKGGLSARELHVRLPEVNLVTIYRNLERFVEEGIIKKLNLDGTEAVFEYQRVPHHHAVCTECHKVIHFTAPDEKIKKLLGIEDFDVDELEVTVRGVCNHQK